jgi:tetratricopeptide (TPR) repeat protein
MGDYAKALPLYEQALAIRKKILGLEHPQTATSINNLAMLHYSMGDYVKALPLYEQALSTSQTSLGSQHPQTKTIRENLKLLNQKIVEAE